MFTLNHTHPYIGGITIWVYLPAAYSFEHRTTRLMGVGAVAELAGTHQPTQLRKIPIQLFRMNIPQGHSFKTWCVSYITTSG
jgi:hypothetical protein